LFYILTDVFQMDIAASQLPVQPLITAGGRNFYAVSVLPSGEIIVSDAVDYVQRSRIYRYSSAGAELQSVRAGIISGSIVWY
jgi:hypothetical protein